MNDSVAQSFPKLRQIDLSPFSQNGRPAILLRDPLRLSGNYMVVPQDVGPVLALMDGTRDLPGIQAALLVHFGMPFDQEFLEHLVKILDDNFLLDNEHSARAHQQALAQYRQAPFRPPMMAGQSYPADPANLRRLLDGYLAEVDSWGQPGPPGPAQGRAIISPHIDYPRGGTVYAAVWQQARQMACDADLVVLLGTDHYSTGELLTLTRQHYASPYGVLPTSQEIVDALAQAIGPDQAFSGELRHRGEHSLELVATWLHHMREGQPVEMVPILTGSFGPFITGTLEPAQDPTLLAFLQTLREQVVGRRVLWVASGDLAHVGPAFGGAPLDAPAKAAIKLADDELIRQLGQGSAEGFFGAIKRVRDRNNVCGVAPFYLMLQLLGEVEGYATGYDQCAADQSDTSFVSVCGMVFG